MNAANGLSNGLDSAATLALVNGGCEVEFRDDCIIVRRASRLLNIEDVLSSVTSTAQRLSGNEDGDDAPQLPTIGRRRGRPAGSSRKRRRAGRMSAEVEDQIIELLKSKTQKEIGQELGYSTSAIANRVAKLKKDGRITPAPRRRARGPKAK